MPSNRPITSVARIGHVRRFLAVEGSKQKQGSSGGSTNQTQICAASKNKAKFIIRAKSRQLSSLLQACICETSMSRGKAWVGETRPVRTYQAPNGNWDAACRSSTAFTACERHVLGSKSSAVLLATGISMPRPSGTKKCGEREAKRLRLLFPRAGSTKSKKTKPTQWQSSRICKGHQEAVFHRSFIMLLRLPLPRANGLDFRGQSDSPWQANSDAAGRRGLGKMN